MIHFVPESSERDTPGPYAEAVQRLASIRAALACVEQVAGKVPSHRDSEARLALAFPGSSPPVQRCFEARSGRVANAAAAGLEAIARLQDAGLVPHAAALDSLEGELGVGLGEIDQLFSL